MRADDWAMHRISSVTVLFVLFAALTSCAKGGGANAPEEATDAVVSPGAAVDEPFTPASAADALSSESELDTAAPATSDDGPQQDDATVDATVAVVADSGVATAPKDAATDTFVSPAPTKPAGTCDDPLSLQQIITCVADRIPRTGSDRYTVPSTALITAWRGVVRQMLSGACEEITLSTELAGARVVRFRDWDNGRTYCVLREFDDRNNDGFVDRGLGTFIVDPAAERELVHSAPHPLTDSTTEKEAITIFRETRSRAYLLNGVARDASTTPSSCQSAYFESDAAHENRHLFQAATTELAAFYGTRDWTQIEWHGMADTTCPGVNAYMTYGVPGAPPAGSRLLVLRDAMRAAHPDWALHAPGTASCSMGGTNNVQGRMLNGVAADNVCVSAASTASGRFIHIEQQSAYRDPNAWIAAVRTAFP
jgi:hypothetical protein